VGGKVEELWRKGFVEKMSFEHGLEEKRVMDSDSCGNSAEYKN